MRQIPFQRPLAVATLIGVAFALAACSAPADETGGSNEETLQIAYMSFAVANSYDAPMLAAAKAVAADNNAEVTVFDANNDPQAQFSQLQDVITSGQYDGIITQPIFGTGLVDLVAQAVAAGIKVVNIDQILGPDLSTGDPQVDGLSANVTFIPTELGTKLGEQVVEACASKDLDPCNVGYLYDIKASALDVAIHQSFTEATAGSPVTVLAEGESFFTPSIALGAIQDMLQAQPDIELIVGSDQGLQGAMQAIEAAGRTGEILMVGFGGSATAVANVASGAWYSDIAQAPATEGSLGMRALIDAIRDDATPGSIDPFADLPNNGIITKDNASEFSPEWPG